MPQKLISPDGQLKLLIYRDGDDTIIGFDGYPWHSHPDVISGEYAIRGKGGLSDEAALAQFVSELTGNVLPIAVLKSGEHINDIWPSFDPLRDLEHIGEGQTLNFRLWNGEAFTPAN